MSSASKRLASGDPSDNDNDMQIARKRLFIGDLSGSNTGGPSYHHYVMPRQTLGPERAQSAQKYVKALNSQFASWIQQQLQSHSLELWEDGVRDYLSHASYIMDEFKDVVDWLRAKKPSSRALPTSSSHSEGSITVSGSQKKTVFNSCSQSGRLESTTLAGLSALQSSSSLAPFADGAGTSSDGRKISTVNDKPSFGHALNGFSSQGALPPYSGLETSGTQNTLHFAASQPATASDPPWDEKKVFFDFNKPLPGPGFAVNSSQATSSFVFSSPATSPFVFSRLQSSETQNIVQFPANQSATSIGNQGIAEAEEGGEEDEAPTSCSPSVQSTEQQGIVVIHQTKCKVYVKHEDPSKGWKDIGVGQLSIRMIEGTKKSSKESKPTIVVRNDVGKILLNAFIYSGIKTTLQQKTVASIFHTLDGGLSGETGTGAVMSRPYLFRLRDEEEASKLAAMIRETAPSD